MSLYNPLNYAAFKRPREDADNPLKDYKEVITRMENYDVTCMEFSPSRLSQYAVTITSGVKIYDAEAKQLVIHLPKVETKVYGATFREDGQMLAMGSENGDVIIHAPYTKKRNPIRILKGHSAATRWLRFTSQSLVSFSDDTTVRLWDVSSESHLHTLQGHQGAVQAGSVHPLLPHLILSGSQDKTVKLWDKRQGESPVFTFQHESQVSKVLFYPCGTKLVSAGDVYVKFWDVRNHTQLSQCVEHSAPIRDLSFLPNQEMVLSASEDKMVKIFNRTSHDCLGMRKFAAPLTSLALSEKHWVVGMAGFCHQVLKSTQELQAPKPKKPRRNKYKISKMKASLDKDGMEEDEPEFHKIDKAMRVYNYNKALKIALNPNIRLYRKMAIFQWLREHNSWKAAVRNFSPELVKSLLELIGKLMGEPNYHEEVEYAENAILETLKSSQEMQPILQHHIEATLPIKLHIRKTYAENTQLMGMAKLLLTSARTKKLDPLLS